MAPQTGPCGESYPKRIGFDSARARTALTSRGVWAGSSGMACHDTDRGPGDRPPRGPRGRLPVARRTLLQALAALLALPVLRLAAPGPSAAAQEVGSPPPDFS